MRILFGYDSIGLGGQQVTIFNFAKELIKCNQNVTWLYCKDKYFKNNHKSKIKFIKQNYSLENKSYLNLFNLIKVFQETKKKIEDLDPNIIVVSSPIMVFVIGVIKKLFFNNKNIKIIFFVGGSLFDTNKTFVKFHKLIRFNNFVDKYLSFYGLDKELRKLNIYSKEKIIPYQVPVDFKNFKPLSDSEREKIKKKLNIPEKGIILGWNGRISPERITQHKQIWNTVQLFKKLRNSNTNIFFLAVGGGKGFDNFKKILTREKLLEYSYLTGWIDYKMMPKYVGIMDFVPLFEKDIMGGGILREAMSCGNIAISNFSKNGTQKSFMKKNCTILVGYSKMLAYSYKIINKLIKNKKRLSLMKKNAREYTIKNLSYEKLAIDFIKAVNK